jgi:hypothetical protein
MILELNKLETSILERLAKEYPFIKEHIPFLKIDNREYTGVGAYVNFDYDNPNNIELKSGIDNKAISTNERIEIDGLKHGLCYEVDITDGKIKFIELVTFGEEWNGPIPDNFNFIK